MKKLTTIISAVIALGLGTAANAQVNLTAETASPGSAPGVSVISLSEVAAKYNVADIQVTTGQTPTPCKMLLKASQTLQQHHSFFLSLCHALSAHMPRLAKKKVQN